MQINCTHHSFFYPPKAKTYEKGILIMDRVVNNLDVSISGLKYKITYFDRNQSFMAEDDGTISKTLAPGEKYDFTFWSSNAKNPRRARLELEFSERLIDKLIKSKHYHGNEYENFIKGHESTEDRKL